VIRERFAIGELIRQWYWNGARAGAYLVYTLNLDCGTMPKPSWLGIGTVNVEMFQECPVIGILV
jgi:hypothetical protein